MSEIYTLFVQGGIMMYPLLLSSVFALAVVMERALFLRKKRILKPHVISLIGQIHTPEEAKMALATLKEEDGPFLNIIRAGLERRGRTREEIKEAILDQGRQETNTLERGLAILETIAGIAPLMGLLGTVLGMIKVFRVISDQGLGQTQLLSGGISEALITTVAGLYIAIPALVAYNYFVHKIERFVLEIEKHSSQLMTKLDRMRSEEKEQA